MPFRCPQCFTRDSLEITASIELPPGSQSDELALQVVSCNQCQFRGLAVYEESGWGRLERDTWEHIGYWASPDAVEGVLKAIQSFPDPLNSRCPCPSHAELGNRQINGIWKGLVEMERGHTFLMRLAL
jgi:hypothetical protein